jgi:hypothetical protein
MTHLSLGKYILLICVSLILISCTSISSRLSDDNFNKIVVCSGGFSHEYGIGAKIEADVKKAKFKADGNIELNYREIIKGTIFSDNSLSESAKSKIYDKYLDCIKTITGETKPQLDITRAYIIDERYIQSLSAGKYKFTALEHRPDVQFEYRGLDDLLIGIIFEVEGFSTKGNRTKLDGFLSIISKNKTLAKATIPSIYTTTEWMKRPTAKATGIEKVKSFLGYGDDYVGRKIPYVMILHDFQPNEISPGHIKLQLTIKDGISKQKAKSVKDVQFKKL